MLDKISTNNRMRVNHVISVITNAPHSQSVADNREVFFNEHGKSLVVEGYRGYILLYIISGNRRDYEYFRNFYTLFEEVDPNFNSVELYAQTDGYYAIDIVARFMYGDYADFEKPLSCVLPGTLEKNLIPEIKNNFEKNAVKPERGTLFLTSAKSASHKKAERPNVPKVYQVTTDHLGQLWGYVLEPFAAGIVVSSLDGGSMYQLDAVSDYDEKRLMYRAALSLLNT